MKQHLFSQSLELIKSVAVIIDLVEYDATYPCLISFSPFVAGSMFCCFRMLNLGDNNVFFIMCSQVNEIYHDESLGVHINVVLVRMIMLGYAKVNNC